MPRVPEPQSTVIAFKGRVCFSAFLAAEVLWQARYFKGETSNMKPGVKTSIPFMKAVLPWCFFAAMEV